MHKLDDTKRACELALGNGSPDRAEVDPAFVLEMASAVESLLAYVEKTDDLTAQELAREIRHRMDSDRAEGGV